MSECKCTLRETAVGDGCRYCNPQFLIDHLADERDEQAVEIEQLQARVKELEAINLGLTKTLVEMEAEKAELRRCVDSLRQSFLSYLPPSIFEAGDEGEA